MLNAIIIVMSMACVINGHNALVLRVGKDTIVLVDLVPKVSVFSMLLTQMTRHIRRLRAAGEEFVIIVLACANAIQDFQDLAVREVCVPTTAAITGNA